MTTALLDSGQPSVYDDDLPDSLARLLGEASEIACDIETSGLDWKTARIALCQFYAAGGSPILVKMRESRPANICRLIESPLVVKVFHHATFDLSFMAHEWSVRPANIWCTKIAAKLLRPGAERRLYSLQSLAEQELGVHMDKSERLSDWLARKYERSQIAYAAEDVAHLLDLRRQLAAKLHATGKTELASRVFAHIPTRVSLDVGGYGDVYSY